MSTLPLMLTVRVPFCVSLLMFISNFPFKNQFWYAERTRIIITYQVQQICNKFAIFDSSNFTNILSVICENAQKLRHCANTMPELSPINQEIIWADLCKHLVKFLAVLVTVVLFMLICNVMMLCVFLGYMQYEQKN